MNKPKELLAADYDKAESGICPNCNMKLKDHSKKKREVCYSMMREKYNLPEPVLLMEDGTTKKMRITKPTKQEIKEHNEKNV